jgi:hypothetical protein
LPKPPLLKPKQANSFEAAPLDLPELDELAPLLDCLPPLAGWDADDADNNGAGDAGATAGSSPHRRRPRSGAAPAARVAHPELQLLRSFSQLQSALRALAAEHARQAAAGAKEAAAAAPQSQRRRQAAAAASGALVAPSSAAALRAAYQAARGPVMDLLGLPLAPPPLRVPLLRFVLPLLESGCMPFGRRDVQRLLQVLGATLAAAAAARADGIPADDGPAAGAAGAGAAAAGGGGAEGAEGVGEVRLALARALARAHIVEVSLAEA